MVRETKYRISKWDKKVDPLIVYNRFTAVKQIGKEQLDPYLVQVTGVEKKVKEYLEKLGVNTIQIAFYLAYARELLGKTFGSIGSETLRNEELAIRSKWVQRGLEDAKLREIAKMFGVDPKPLPLGVFEVEYVTLVQQTQYDNFEEYFDQNITQTFKVNKTCWIKELCLALDYRRPITITFYEGYKGKELFTLSNLTLDDLFHVVINGIDFYLIQLPFTKLSPDKVYSFNIFSQDVYLGYMSDPNSYPDGDMYVDNVKQNADLTFVIRGIAPKS